MSEYQPDFSLVEDTTPAEESAPAEPAAAEETTDATPEAEAEQLAQQQDEATPAAEEPAAPAPFLTIKYNHENIDMSEEEVRKTVQLAKKNESVLAELDYLAAQNDQSVADFVRGLNDAADNAYLDMLHEKYGEDDEETIQTLLKAHRDANKDKYDALIAKRAEAAKADEDSLTERIANELTDVQRIFPDVKDFNSLPETVRKAALNGGDLMKEYLLYRHNEDLKVQKNKAAETKAASAASGSVKSSGETDESADTSAFMRGLWGT